MRRAHGDVEKAHPLDVDFEDGDVRAEAGGHARRVDARRSAAEHDDLARQHARHAAEQNAFAAVRLGQKMAADDDRHAPGDFAHRLEQGQAVVTCDRFVGDGGCARFQQRGGEVEIGGEMEVGEKSLALAKQRKLARERFLDLDDEVGVEGFLVGIDELGARGGVIVVRVAGIDARAALNDDVVAVLDELVDAGRQQADAMLLRFDFLGYADGHGRNFDGINGITE